MEVEGGREVVSGKRQKPQNRPKHEPKTRNPDPYTNHERIARTQDPKTQNQGVREYTLPSRASNRNERKKRPDLGLCNS